MLNQIQIEEIKEHLNKAQNPLFFFDNDADGLSSFLILQRYIGRGKGVVIKGLSSLQKSYFRKVEELKPDYIFCLDRPSVDADFMQLADEKNIPVVCIDHHQYEGQIIKNYYNTFHTSGKIEPVSYLCYKIVNRKEDMWLSVIGCIGDCFIPEFLDDFKKQYPELLNFNYKSAFDILYNTDLGKMIMVLNFGLKDTTKNAISLIKYLIKSKNPHDILEENSKTKTFLKRYEYLNNCTEKIVANAEKNIDEKKKLLFYTYSGAMSLSKHAADKLFYKHPNLTIVIGFINGNRIKFSIRGNKNVRQIIMDSFKNIEGATGGGHEHSSGAQMNVDDIPIFKADLLKELEKDRKK